MSTGINKHIQFAIDRFQEKLWVGYSNSYDGRSFRLNKKGRTTPYVYTSNNDYKEVHTTDNYDSIVHFDLEPNRPKIGKSFANADVNIIFAVNLGKVYSAYDRPEAIERAIKDINNILINTAFQVNNVLEYPDALADYDLDEKEEHKFNMQPYYVVKFECECNYQLNNTCDVVEPTQFELTLSYTGGDGTVTPFEGTQTKSKNEIIAINAEPDAGFNFVQWLINGVSDLVNPTWVKMTSNITAIAEFINTLTPIQDIFTTPPTQSGDDWIYEDQTVNNNNVIIKNNQIFDTDALGVGLNALSPIYGGEPIDISYYFELKPPNNYINCFIYNGADSSTRNGMYARYDEGTDNFFVATRSNSSTLRLITINNFSTNLISGINELNLTWNGQSDGNFIVTLNSVEIGNSTLTTAWSGLPHISDATRFLWGLSRWYFNGYIYRIVSNIGKLKFDVDFSDQDGVIVKDSSKYFNDLSIVNSTSYDVWGVTSDLQKPSPLIEGCFLNKNSIGSDTNIRVYKNDTFNISNITEKWDGATEYNIYDDGTGDYTTPRAAILAQNGIDFIKINVHPGTYIENDLLGQHNVWLNCIGSVTFISDGLSTNISPSDYSFAVYANTAYNLIPQEFKHNVYLNKSMLITGGRFEGNDIKYNIHQDSGANDYKSFIYDSYLYKVENNDPSFPSNVGIGLYNNQEINYIDCTFEAVTTDSYSVNSARVFMHNDTNETKPIIMRLIGCRAVNGNLVQISQLDNVNDVKDIVHIENCTLDDPTKGVHYSATSDLFAYTININVKNTSLQYTEENRADYLDYVQDYIIDSGIIRYLKNTYTGIKYSDWELNEKTFDEIYNEPESANYEITKDNNTVNQLIIRE